MTRTAVWSSDLQVHREVTSRVGQFLGHEIIEEMEEIGPKVWNFRFGDRGVVPFDISGRVRSFCKRDCMDVRNVHLIVDVPYGRGADRRSRGAVELGADS